MSIKLKLTFILVIMNWNPYTLSLNNTCIEFNAEPGIACIDRSAHEVSISIPQELMGSISETVWDDLI